VAFLKVGLAESAAKVQSPVDTEFGHQLGKEPLEDIGIH